MAGAGASIAGCGKSGETIDDKPAVWPAATADAPLVVFIHGGAWTRGDKSQARGLADAFNRHGYALASVNYRLFPSADIPAQVLDVCAGIRHLTDKAKELRINSTRLALIGFSAGGNIAALVASSVPARALVLLDAVALDVEKELPFSPEFRRVFGVDPLYWASVSPVNAVRARRKVPPTLIAHTDFRHDTVPQAEQMATALKESGVEFELKFYPGRRHGAFLRGIRRQGDELSNDVFKFLGDKLEP